MTKSNYNSVIVHFRTLAAPVKIKKTTASLFFGYNYLQCPTLQLFAAAPRHTFSMNLWTTQSVISKFMENTQFFIKVAVTLGDAGLTYY